MKRHGPEERDAEPPLWAAAAESEKRAAQNRAELGQNIAATKAEDVRPGWFDAALEQVRLFAVAHETFLAESVSVEVPSSADPRAVGAVFATAKRKGWIESAGWAPANSSNRSAKTLWRSRVYVGSEQHA